VRQHTYASHDAYVAEQVLWNKRKLGMVWVSEISMKIVAEHIKKHLPDAKFGICHGTRRGAEQKWLREMLGIEVIGTEISDTASQFPHTIQWDFHDVKTEWAGSVDFIYSNSLDHSCNPQLAMGQWMSCLRPGGLCFIDWDGVDHADSHVNSLDCFGASIGEMKTFLSRFATVEKIPVDDGRKEHFLLVLKKD